MIVSQNVLSFWQLLLNLRSLSDYASLIAQQRISIRLVSELQACCCMSVFVSWIKIYDCSCEIMGTGQDKDGSREAAAAKNSKIATDGAAVEEALTGSCMVADAVRSR